MSQYLDAREWTVEELGQSHAVLTTPSVADDFVIPRHALPPGLREGDAISVLATADQMAAERAVSGSDPSLEPDDRSSGADAIFAEALEALQGVKAAGG